MITALMLLPVLAVLTWLYGYLLPPAIDGARRWRLADSLLWLALVLAAGSFIYVARHAVYEGAGPLWPELVAATGAYVVLAGGLAVGLACRRRGHRHSKDGDPR